MKTFKIAAWGMALSLGAGSASAYGDKNTYNYTVHPGFTVSAVNLGKTYSNMEIDWLSNGDMVLVNCETSGSYGGGGVPGPNAESGVYIVKNVTGSPSVTQIASNFRQPSGGVVVNDVIYVSDRDAFYKINSNTGSGANNRTKVIDWPKDKTPGFREDWNNGWWHQWVFCPVYHNGKFYAVYSGSIVGGGASETIQSTSYSGAFLSWALDGAGGFQKYAGGFRSPNGANLGANGIMLVADNQGSWLPSCSVALIKQNKFYGHHQNTGFDPNWAQAANAAGTMPYEPPVAWMLDGDAGGNGGPGQSTSQPLYLDRGPFAGDWIVGDNNAKGISRLTLDPVNGGSGVTANYNSSVTFFTNGFGDQGSEAGPNRLALHPTENILYVGTIGTLGNWPSSTGMPFYQIKFDDAAVKAAFEIKAVRSRAQGVEIEFSNPINPSTAVAASFSLAHYQLQRQDGYGAGNNTIAAPAISNVQVSGDNKRVFLQVGNIAQNDRVLKITLPGIRSASGAALWFNQAYFTHNFQSTQPFEPTTRALPQVDKFVENHVSQRMLGGSLLVNVTLSGDYAVSLRTLNGTRVEEKTGRNAGEFTFAGMRRGMYVVQVVQGKRSYARPVFL